MNKLIIIGNGFDLAHGMKTSYSDFVYDYFLIAIKSSLKGSRPFEDENMVLFVDEVFELKSKTNFFSLRRAFKGVGNADIPMIIADTGNRRMLYDCANTIFLVMKNSFLFRDVLGTNIFHWMDFEHMYFLQLRNLRDAYMANQNDSGIVTLQREFNSLKKLLAKYLKAIKSPKLIEGIDKLINNYFSKTHNVISGNKEGDILFLNFNYTQTIKLYLVEKFPDARVINIHGDLIDNEIVFGYGDENGSDYRSIENLNCNAFFDNVKSFYYLKNGKHQALMNFIELGPFHTEVWGHSCSISDRTLLKRIMEDRHNSYVKIFYHIIDENRTNFMEVSQNLSRHFSDKYSFRTKVINEQNCSELPKI